MPTTELKQRKKTQKQNEESSDTLKNNLEDETTKVKKTEGVNLELRETSLFSSPDLRTLTCLLSLVVCLILTWTVLQQNGKFTDVEEKYKILYRKTASLLEMEEEVLKVSKKLAASEDELQVAHSASSLITQLQQEISSLHGAIAAMQADDNSASRDLQTVNGRFLNLTETWQERLAAVTTDLAALKAESREAHSGATDRVNEAERRARALAERLEELEDSTRRNARALERSEDEDIQRAQNQLDWNTKQIHKLEDQVRTLIRTDAEMSAQLQEHIPRAQECEAHLPAVEEAVRSILRLGGDMSGAERRLEELTLQVFGTEDSMLKALTEILEIRKGLDALQAHNSILKMKSELGLVAEAVRELSMVVMGVGSHPAQDSKTLEDIEEGEEFEDEEEEWEDPQPDDQSKPVPDDDLTCASVQDVLGGLGGQQGALLPHLERDVSQLKEWAAGLTEARGQLQVSLAALTTAVGQIEERTSAIAKDVTNKVASVRTDVRRMDGLQSEVESLLTQVGELEDRAAQVERSMVKRIGDVLGDSIDRMAGLRATSERNAKALEQLLRQIPELVAADKRLSGGLRELESGRARLIRTVTFAGDLKPKVATIKRDFAALEPQLADLTHRIGRLAEDLTKREADIADLRLTFANLNVVEGDLGVVTQQFSQITDMPHVGEILPQANMSEAVPQTHTAGE